MGVKKAVKAVLKEAAGEPMKLKKLVRLVKGQAEDPSTVTKEKMIEACEHIRKAHIKKGLAWYGAEDGVDVWLTAKKSRDLERCSSGERSISVSRNKAKGASKETPKDTQAHKVFVSGLDKAAKWQDLKDQFKDNVGPVVIVRAIPGGMAVVEFATRRDAETLVAMDGDEFCGRIIRTKFDGQRYSDQQRATSRLVSKRNASMLTQDSMKQHDVNAGSTTKKPKPNKITFE